MLHYFQKNNVSYCRSRFDSSVKIRSVSDDAIWCFSEQNEAFYILGSVCMTPLEISLEINNLNKGDLFAIFKQNIAPCWPGVMALTLRGRYLKIMTSGRHRGPDQGELDSWRGERCQDLCGPINTLCFNSWCHLTYHRDISPKTQHGVGHLVKNSPFDLALSFNLITMYPHKTHQDVHPSWMLATFIDVWVLLNFGLKHYPTPCGADIWIAG